MWFLKIFLAEWLKALANIIFGRLEDILKRGTFWN